MTSDRRAYWWMLLGAASFSVMSFLTHTLSSTCSWQLVAAMRTGVAFVLTIALALAMRTQLVLWRPRTLWIRSFAGSVALVANFYSMTHYPISEVLALSNMFPLWVAVLSWPVLGERPKASVWLAAACGVSGVYLLQQPTAERAAEQVHSTLPVVSALVASFASAIAMLGLHRLKGIDERAIVAHFSGVSLLFTLVAFFALPRIVAPPTEAVFQHETADAVVRLLVLGCAATAGQLFLTKAFASGPPAQVSVVGLTQIGFSMLLEVVFEGRQFSPTTLAGLALVVAPTAWIMTHRHSGRQPADEVMEPMSDE